jgi:hypothetical protein
MADGSRRFSPPRRADKVPGGYVVRDATGQALAYLYGRETEADAYLVCRSSLYPERSRVP